MKVALVHELLTMRGGAERVLKVVAEMFPEAPIYTLLYDEKKLGDWFPRERIRFSILQMFSGLSTNHHLYLRRFPKAVEQWDFSEFDLVISFSSAFAHGIQTSGKTKHLSYIHTPARYLWDRTFDVLDRVCPVGALHATPLQGRVMLTFVGDGPMTPHLQSLTKELHIEDQVQFLHRVHGEEKQKIFAEHDLLIIPSITEISPNVALEARSVGLPVLLTKETGLSEPLTKGMLLRDLITPEQIHAALVEALQNYEKIAEAAASPLQKRDWNTVAEEWMKLLSPK